MHALQLQKCFLKVCVKVKVRETFRYESGHLPLTVSFLVPLHAQFSCHL